MWWPAVVFGWPGPILAILLSVVGVVRRKVPLLIVATVVVFPFSFYLLLTPRFPWGILLPVLPLIAARATSRGATRIAWVSVLLLAGTILLIAGLMYTRALQLSDQ